MGEGFSRAESQSGVKLRTGQLKLRISFSASIVNFFVKPKGSGYKKLENEALAEDMFYRPAERRKVLTYKLTFRYFLINSRLVKDGRLISSPHNKRLIDDEDNVQKQEDLADRYSRAKHASNKLKLRIVSEEISNQHYAPCSAGSCCSLCHGCILSLQSR